MSEVKRIAAIIVLTVCLVGPFGVSIWQASRHPPQAPSQSRAADQESDATNQTPREKTDEAIARYTKELAYFTAILAIATIGLGIGTFFQIKLGRAEFNATHRPKIIIHAIEFRRVPHNDGDDDWDRVGVIFLCFNTGESPAKNVEARGQILAVADTPINVQRPIVESFPVIKSGEKFTFEINSDWLVRELHQRKEIGYPSFKCVGTVVYFDGNGTRRETAFYRELILSVSGERWDSAKSPQHEYEY
ncbi:MAG: hypothetical protein WB764_28220 [Xanthobacteraceae bacterium]